MLTCAEPTRWTHGSRRVPVLDGVPTVALPAHPGRAELDPVLAEHTPGRILVHGDDADLAAVLLRLLRTERLGVEVAYVAAARRSGAVAAWGLPVGSAAVALALDGRAERVPLVRDDTGGVLVGRGEVRDLDGECYCDDVLVRRGAARRLVVTPHPDGVAVRAGRGAASGRAVQLGGRPFEAVSDGVRHPRPLERRTWYRHTADWLLVRP